VSLAHSRGILHRDLKPENVMVGPFGEVYLVDWGIAVSLRPDPSGRLPLASRATELAGTPAYMAPEMLGSGTLTERTDVYLLGAVLHEILTGAPPHAGRGFREVVMSILTSSFDYPTEHPRALTDIARRAMNPEAERRFVSADELRHELESFLRHRGSLVLSDEAERRARDMTALVDAAEERGDARDRIYALFVEARFGFRQALVASADNEEARQGLRRVIETVVEYELARGMPEAAAAALADLEAPSPVLAERVRRAVEERDAERAHVAKLASVGAALDPAVGRRTRMVVTLAMGFVWTVGPEVMAWVIATRPLPPRVLYLWNAFIVAVGFGLVRWARDSLFKTAVNRRFVAATMIMTAGQLALEVGGVVLGLPFTTIVVLHLLLWFMAMMPVAGFIESKLWPAAVAMMAGFLFAAAYPQHVWHIMSLANLALVVNAFVAWAEPASDRAYARDRLRDELEAVRRLHK
jgi:serine/threonine-protein kinase